MQFMRRESQMSKRANITNLLEMNQSSDRLSFPAIFSAQNSSAKSEKDPLAIRIENSKINLIENENNSRALLVPLGGHTTNRKRHRNYHST